MTEAADPPMPERHRHYTLGRWAPFGRRAPIGALPGTLVRDPDAEETRIRVLCYGADGIEQFQEPPVDGLRDLMARWTVTWIQVTGLRDIELIDTLGRALDLHELALEDAVSGHHRPKVESYEDYSFVIVQAPPWNLVQSGDAMDFEHMSEQLAIFFGRSFVLTIQSHNNGRFDTIRERLYTQRGRIRRSRAGFLVYTLLDLVIDEYFPLVERYGELLEDLEADIVRNPDRRAVQRIQRMRRSLLGIRRAIWPQREVIYALSREAMPHVGSKTRVYLRDCADHVTQLIDITEMYRELTTGLLDIYLSCASARTNEVMRLLTIIATIFIPLGTVASIYGMNFDTQLSPWNMPELSWYYGYPYALGLMAAMAAGMLAYFWRKGWLGARDPANLIGEDERP